MGHYRNAAIGREEQMVGLYDGNGIKDIGISYSLNQWVHVVLVHQNGTLYAYKNGVLVGSTPAGDITSDYENVEIGWNGDFGG